MKKNINVEVNSIRLEENTETPIMLLLDPNSQKVLPIWIGTIEAVSIAYAQEGIKHPRPQTHDLIIDIIESLNGNIDEVVISDLHDNTYFAEIIILGDQGRVSLSARPSDAIALALRADTTISVNEDLFLNNSIDLIHDKIDRNKKINIPIQVLWGKKGVIGKQFNPIKVWQKYSNKKVFGIGINSGHFIPEQKPKDKIKQLKNFFLNIN